MGAGKLFRGGKLVAVLAASVFVSASLVGCSANSDQGADGGPVTIRVATAVDKYYGYMPVAAHEKLKTFEGTNLKIEVISATTPTIGQVLASGQADIAMAGAGALVSHHEAGIPVELVASILSPWDYYVIVSNKGNFAGATSLEQLKGANFGITGKGSPGNYMLAQYAEKFRWSKNDFKETALGDVGSLFAAIAAGKVDATLWAPDRAYITEAEGVATHFALPDVTPNVLHAFGVSTKLLKNNPAAVKEFLTAYYAKVKEMQTDPAAFVSVLEDWKVASDVAQKLAKNQLPLLSTDGAIKKEELEGVAKSVPFLSGRPEKDAPSVTVDPWQDLGS